MTELLPMGPAAWVVLTLYLLSLIAIGYVARRARRENTLADFYLGGRGIGFVILFLTLFATAYSGNSIFGFTGTVYRVGLFFILSLHFMIATTAVFLLFAPWLKRLADRRNYITPIDFIQDRYGSSLLSVSMATVMCLALGNYLLAQLMAMGRAMQGLATVEPVMAFAFGVVVLALIMVIYGTLGGLRAVAWTDAIQGIILFMGLAALLLMIFQQFGSLGDATRLLQQRDAMEGTRYTAPPDAMQAREWLSYILVAGFGAALYPQTIQRIFAAKSLPILRKSFCWILFMPFIAVCFVFVVGVFCLAYIPGLEGAEADQVLGRLLREIQGASSLGYWLVVIVIGAVLAAMMSSADSALLSISSMLSKDVYGLVIKPEATEAQMTRFGKACSWTLVILLVLLAILLREQTSLISLIDRKFDLLVQMVPAFIVGLHWKGLRTGPVTLGFVIGILLAIVLAFGNFEFVERGKIYGFHPGLVALIPNMIIAVLGSLLSQPRTIAREHIA